MIPLTFLEFVDKNAGGLAVVVLATLLIVCITLDRVVSAFTSRRRR